MSKRSKSAGTDAGKQGTGLFIKFKRSWDEEGVASTVGTILSILVFLTFLGMFVNQVVPLMMKDNENAHMDEVVGQFSNLKAAIDLQIISATSNLPTAPIYTPIKLHAEGIPMFASDTVGSLDFNAFNPDPGNYYPTVNLTYGDLNPTNGGKAGGNLEFYGANRYFVEQIITYENGAIILSQPDGEIVLSGMSIRVTNSSSGNTIQITLVGLTGMSSAIGGSGTKSVTSTVDVSSRQILENEDQEFNLTINTIYGDAWERYFNDLQATTEGGSSWETPAKFEIKNAAGTTVTDEYGNKVYSVSLIIPHVDSLDFTKAMTSIKLADISV